MPSVNIHRLSGTRQLNERLRPAKTVELRERQRAIARIVPLPRRRPVE